jgi:hypothetical protein
MKKEYKEFWKDIIYKKDGSLNEKQVLKEMSDFSFMMDNVPKVYCAITNHRLSKCLYPANTVISVFEELFLDKEIAKDDVSEMIKSCGTIEDLVEELRDYFEIDSPQLIKR